MPEQINIKADSLPMRFLAAAVILAERPDALLRGSLTASVQLLVNGIEVPFGATLQQLELELQSDVQNRALDEAANMITGLGLQPTLRKLEAARRSVMQALLEVRERCPAVEPTAERVQ